MLTAGFKKKNEEKRKEQCSVLCFAGVIGFLTLQCRISHSREPQFTGRMCTALESELRHTLSSTGSWNDLSFVWTKCLCEWVVD